MIWSAINFSEGCDASAIRRIASAIEEHCRVIDVSSDCDHNRSVITLLGNCGEVLNAAVAGALCAKEIIDLTKHTGAHPRIGATDVIPCVPLGESNMADAVELSYAIGDELWNQAQIPSYFYENSALIEERKNLPAIRRGGFEKLVLSDTVPDRGKCPAHKTAGATAIGAREPLVAYNINLKTNDIEFAKATAKKIRLIRDYNKGFLGVKAIGVHLKSQNKAQLSFNITRTDKASMYDLFDFAIKNGATVSCSELIGAIRLGDLKKAVSDAGDKPAETLEELMQQAEKHLLLYGLNKNVIINI